MDSVTEEKLNKLKEELADIIDKITDLQSKSNKDLWGDDLNELKNKYESYYSKLEKLEDLSKVKISTTLKTKKQLKKIIHLQREQEVEVEEEEKVVEEEKNKNKIF